MKRWLCTLWLLGVAVSLIAAERPNILIILSDDMGFSDLGCYGGEIQTPNLDALAANGVRFTQFYNAARCCPTRAALLTGLYPHQAGVGHMTDDRGLPGYRGEINRQCVTLAEALRVGGYRTYMCGKWHVCRDIRPDGDKSNWPVQRGFEKFYGTITGGGSFYDPTTLCRQNTFITPENDPEYRPGVFYYTDAISDNAVQFLAAHARGHPAEPFFLYVAYTAAHWPMHALEKDIAKYRGRYDGGYAPVREARFARLQQLGLVDRCVELSPQAEDWATVTNLAWEARCMEVYAAMVDAMDQGIGRILAQLRRDGRLDNTVIFFLQDNGACAEGMGRTSNSPRPPRCARWARTNFNGASGRQCRRVTVVGSAPARTLCPVRRTPTLPTVVAGPTCPTRRSVNTNTGCTKAASARPSLCTGRKASLQNAAAPSNPNPDTSWI